MNIKNFFTKDTNLLFYLILLVILNIFLSSLYNSSLTGDDAYNSQIRGLLIINDQTIFEKIYIESIAWAKGASRMTPIMFGYVYGLFYFIQNVLILKFLVIFVIYLDLIFFFKIIYYLSCNKSFSYSATIFVLPFLHFKAWHDAILSFFILIPLMVLFLLSSILFFLKADKKIYFNFFIVIFLISIFTYELSYFFPFFYFFFCFFFIKEQKQKKLFYLSTIIVFTHFILSKLIFYLFNESGQSTYPGTEIILDLKINILTFFYQIISSIPGIWFFAKNTSRISFEDLNLIVLIIFIILGFLSSNYFFQFKNKSKVKNSNIIFIFSILLIFIPAIIPSISKGTSTQIINLGVGYGYTSVYFQFFGLSLFFFKYAYQIFIFLKSKNLRILNNIFFTLFFVFSYFIYSYNDFIVKNSNKSNKFSRNLIEEAISSGLLDEINNGDLIIRNYRYPSDNSWFYSMKAKKKIIACGLNLKNEFPKCLTNFKFVGIYTYDRAFKESLLEQKNIPNKIYAMSYYKSEKNLGYVVLAEIESINQTNEIYHTFKFKKYKYYDQKLKKVSIRNSENYLNFMKVINSATFLEEFMESKFKINDIEIIFKNFLSVEGSKTDYFRWASNDGEMIIINSYDQEVIRKLNFTLLRPNYENITVNLISEDLNKKISFSNRINVQLEIKLKPGLNKYRFSTDSPKVNEDPRNLVFAIYNYEIN